MVHIGPSVP